MNASSLFLPVAFCALLLGATSAFAEDAPPTPASEATPVAAPAENAVAAMPIPDPASVAVQHWETLVDKSSVEWSVGYGTKPITGTFKDFSADIAFDPEHLAESSVMVQINIASISSDDKDAQSSLPGEEWFDAAKFPKATFEAKTFRHIEDEKYEADGTLTIGEKKNPLTLPFTVHFYDDRDTVPAARYAQVTGEATIKRLEYGLGKGDWANTSMLTDEVKVTISLKAKQMQPAAAP